MCSDELDVIERVLAGMLLSGWLGSFTYSRSKGWGLERTALGDERLSSLNEVVTSFGLMENEGASERFYKRGKIVDFSTATDVRPEERRALNYFASCVEELGLTSENELAALTRIATWQ